MTASLMCASGAAPGSSGSAAAAWIYTALVFVFLFLPILIVVIYSFNAGRNVNQLMGFSTKWYAMAWADRFLMNALRNSLTIAGDVSDPRDVDRHASALAMDRLRPRGRAGCSSCSPTWRSSCRHRHRHRDADLPGDRVRLAEPVARIPRAGRRAGAGPGHGSVIAAHTLFTLAIVNVLVRTRMRGMDRTLIEASEDLFATPLRTFGR